MPTRHSPFYAPFLILHAGGFLKKQSLDSELRIPAPGESAFALLKKGEIDVIQGAVGAAWLQRERGEQNIPVHIAQINQRDGFFLAGRHAEPDFSWSKLEGKTLIAEPGHQPLVMLRWSLHCRGVDWSKIHVVQPGPAPKMEAAFLAGEGDYVHLQAGTPHQWQYEARAHVIASVGEGLPPVAFSSIAIPRGFLDGESRARFLSAFAEAKAWSQRSGAREVARVIQPFFLSFHRDALEAAIADIQRIGCWEGGIEISRECYDEAQRAFLWSGEARETHAWEDACE